MKPKTEAELADVLRQIDTPLRIKGGATRWPLDGTQTLDLSALSGIELYEPGALTLVAGAGTSLDEVEDLLAREGQMLPFEPGRVAAILGQSGQSTLGGVVATNASGPRRIKAGACRDSVIGIRFVDGRGRVVSNGGRVMKNVTGYDLARLMTGSWGRLGAISQISFKLLPRPQRSATLILYDLPPQEGLAVMAAALKTPYDVSGAAFAHAGAPARAQVMLRIEGFADSVAYRSKALAAQLAPWGKAEVSDDPALWTGIRDLEVFRDMPGDIWRLSCAPRAAEEILDRLGDVPLMIDWGGARIYAAVPAGRDILAQLASHDVHGLRLRGDNGPAFAPLSPAEARLSAALRNAYDPKAILNPGVMEAANANDIHA